MCSENTGSEADAISLCVLKAEVVRQTPFPCVLRQRQRGRRHFILCSVRGSEADAISLCVQTEVMKQMPFHFVFSQR